MTKDEALREENALCDLEKSGSFSLGRTVTNARRVGGATPTNTDVGILDDVAAGTKFFESLVKGEDTLHSGMPESFNALIKEIQSLGLTSKLRKRDEMTQG